MTTPRNTIIATAIVTAGVVAGLVGGVTAALWTDTFSSPAALTAHQGALGFGVVGPGGTLDAASGPADPVSFVLGATQAQALAADPASSIALPFDVYGYVLGDAGLDYTIAPPAWATGSLLASTTMRVFPVDTPADCTVANAPATQPALAGTVLAPLYAATPRTGVDHWCVTFVAADPGSYANTATVTGLSAIGAALGPAKDAWNARLLADPAAQADGTFTLTHTVVKGG